jgi:hypothetical protein
MKSGKGLIIITFDNESWELNEQFGASYICRQLRYGVCSIISQKDIKLIARPKK